MFFSPMVAGVLATADVCPLGSHLFAVSLSLSLTRSWLRRRRRRRRRLNGFLFDLANGFFSLVCRNYPRNQHVLLFILSPTGRLLPQNISRPLALALSLSPVRLSEAIGRAQSCCVSRALKFLKTPHNLAFLSSARPLAILVWPPGRIQCRKLYHYLSPPPRVLGPARLPSCCCFSSSSPQSGRARQASAADASSSLAANVVAAPSLASHFMRPERMHKQ